MLKKNGANEYSIAAGPAILAACLAVFVLAWAPSRSLAHELGGDVLSEEVDFTQVVDAVGIDGDEAVALDYDGQPSTDETVAAVYKQFLSAFDANAETLAFADGVTVGEVRRAFSLVVANEEYYWAAPKYSLSFLDDDGDKKADDDEGAVKATLRYVVSDLGQIAQVKKQVEAAVSEGLALIDAKSMGEYEIALALHDYVLAKATYKSGGDVSGYTPYGALVLGSAVCQGYSLSYKLLLKRAGLNCLYVSSSAMNHSWDLVEIQGKWYHADCTWDDTGYNTHEYFLRSDRSFQSGLSVNHYGWTTAYFTADDDYADRSNQLFRLYNPYTGEHLYTLDAKERDKLVKAGWKYEGVGWNAPKYSRAPVYRLFNKYSDDHHYTTSKDEYDSCVKNGWSGEGIAWYSDVDKGTTLYRLFNPFETVGTHHYTTSETERNTMVTDGWKDEGVAWYGM